jgi:hypothetical protein
VDPIFGGSLSNSVTKECPRTALTDTSPPIREVGGVSGVDAESSRALVA